MKDLLGFALGETFYSNPLASPSDIADFQLEGQAKISFPNQRLRMENALDPALGQDANFVFWCPEEFPDNIRLTWDFYPLREPGLCIIFFAARGSENRHLFDPTLRQRTGRYEHYHSGDINALHLSYYRRKHPKERAFCSCNLRKSRGFHLVSQGADPLPGVADALPPYHLSLWKLGPRVAFSIRHDDEEILILDWTDDDSSFGPRLASGRVGFRQMAPLIGEYSHFQVHKLTE